MDCCTVEPPLKDRPIDQTKLVSQDRWSLVIGSITLKCRTCQEYLVFQDRWSLMAMVSQDRFHCITCCCSSSQWTCRLQSSGGSGRLGSCRAISSPSCLSSPSSCSYCAISASSRLCSDSCCSRGRPLVDTADNSCRALASLV